jgi:hypothetical protein
MRRIVLALALLVCSGCSFIVVRGSPSRAPGDPGPPRCSSAPVGPVIDTAAVVLATIAAITAHSKLSNHTPGEDINYDFLRFQRDWSIVGGALFAGSAAYGWVRTTRCRNAKNAYWENPTPPAAPTAAR